MFLNRSKIFFYGALIVSELVRQGPSSVADAFFERFIFWPIHFFSMKCAAYVLVPPCHVIFLHVSEIDNVDTLIHV